MIKIIKKIVISIFTIKPRDEKYIIDLKNNFEHSKRSFRHGWLRFMVDSLYCHAVPGTLESVVGVLLALPKGRLLNLGGGTGQVARIFNFLGFDVVNIDLDIDEADQDDNNIKADLNSSLEINIPEHGFDVVVCQEIIEHIENPWKLFRDVKKNLKSTGTFILSTPNPISKSSRLRFIMSGFFDWFTPNCFSYHINPLFDWEIRLIAEKNGFEVLSMIGNGDYFFKRGRKGTKKILNHNEGLIYVLKLR